MTADSLFTLKGKTALVTGASYGLGVTFAETLAGAGANLVLAARSLDKLQALAARLTAAGHKALAVKCDVGNPEDVAAMVAAGWQHFGRIDVLVNNAGVVAEATIVPEKIPHELFEQTMRVNVLGTWYCCREVAARQLADGKGGSIINIARSRGCAGVARFSDRVSDVESGGHQPDAQPGVQLGGPRDPRQRDRPGVVPERDDRADLRHRRVPIDGSREAAPQGRVGDPNELAGPLLLLASDAGSFMTGHTLVVDGGLVGDRRGRARCRKASATSSPPTSPNDLGKRIVAANRPR